MKYPVMNRTPKRTVSIPTLSGGVNTRDTKSGILDNQLSDAKNVWFKNGALRTRPNFETNSNLHVANWDYDYTNWFGSKVHRDIEYQGKVLCSLSSRSRVQDEQTIAFIWQGKNSVERFGYVEFSVDEEVIMPFFVASYDDTVYVYVSNGKIYKKTFGSASGMFTEITEDEMIEKAPIIMTNGLRTGTAVGDHIPEYTADLLGSFNTIGEYAKILYSTINPDYSNSDKNNMPMIYYFNTDNSREEYQDPSPYEGYKVVVKHTSPNNGIVTHTVVLDSSGVGIESTVKDDGYKLKCSKDSVKFYNSNGEIASIDNDDNQILNNLEITFPHKTDISKIFGCNFCEWYGGVSEGINGGTRLFVSGNSNHTNTVYWSDLNNPLYFPENNWFNVGTTGSKVTAFGKQNDKLIIFKENETWYTEYTQTTSPTAEEIENQSFIDLTTANAMFPLVLINDKIGCDCPNTVELCRNRLVFTNSSGRVYVIVTTNQYSENNIYEIGGMIENRLKTETNLKAATSADFEGHYCIIVGQNMYLCDYNSYGFQYAYSFKNEDDSQLRIPWYIWELPFVGNYFSYEDFIFYGKWDMIDAIPSYNRGKYYISSVLCESNDATEDKKLELIPPITGGQTLEFNIIKENIVSEFTSKLFTFGAPDTRKNIERVSIFTSDNEGQQITIDFVTEGGTETETYFANNNDISECKTILPSTKCSAKFGIQMSSMGKLTVEGITIIYRMLGVIR